MPKLRPRRHYFANDKNVVFIRDEDALHRPQQVATFVHPEDASAFCHMRNMELKKKYRLLPALTGELPEEKQRLQALEQSAVTVVPVENWVHPEVANMYYQLGAHLREPVPLRLQSNLFENFTRKL